MKRKYKIGQKVVLYTDRSGEIPYWYLGRVGKIVAHAGIEDDKFLYEVKFIIGKRVRILTPFEDELRLAKEKKVEKVKTTKKQKILKGEDNNTFIKAMLKEIKLRGIGLCDGSDIFEWLGCSQLRTTLTDIISFLHSYDDYTIISFEILEENENSLVYKSIESRFSRNTLLINFRIDAGSLLRSDNNSNDFCGKRRDTASNNTIDYLKFDSDSAEFKNKIVVIEKYYTEGDDDEKEENRVKEVDDNYEDDEKEDEEDHVKEVDNDYYDKMT